MQHSPGLKRKLKTKLNAGDGRALARVLTMALAAALVLFLATNKSPPPKTTKRQNALDWVVSGSEAFLPAGGCVMMHAWFTD